MTITTLFVIKTSLLLFEGWCMLLDPSSHLLVSSHLLAELFTSNVNCCVSSTKLFNPCTACIIVYFVNVKLFIDRMECCARLQMFVLKGACFMSLFALRAGCEHKASGGF